MQPLCLHSLFLSAPSVRGIAVFLRLRVKLLLFFPGDIYFCQKHLLSLDSNATEASWALFFPLSLLSNDPFCQSKQFAIKPPPPASLCWFFFFLKYINSKDLTAVGEWIGFQDGIELKGWSRAGPIPMMMATWWQRVDFTNKYLFSIESVSFSSLNLPASCQRGPRSFRLKTTWGRGAPPEHEHNSGTSHGRVPRAAYFSTYSLDFVGLICTSLHCGRKTFYEFLWAAVSYS